MKHCAASGVYNGLDAALEAASTHDCQEVAIHLYHQRTKTTRTYPVGTQFSIAPALSEQLAKVDTSKVAAFKKAMDSLGQRVVTSVSRGYVAALELHMRFTSSKDVMSFKAGLATHPSAFAFLIGASDNSNNDTTTGSASSSVGHTQDNNDRESSTFPAFGKNLHQNLNSLTQLARHIRRSNIKVEITSNLFKYGALANETPRPNIRSYFGSNSEPQDIASLVQCIKAYDEWINQNLSKAIVGLGVVGVASKPIVSLLTCASPMTGLLYENEPLNLESARERLDQKLKERKTIAKEFVTKIDELQSSEITPEQKTAKEQKILDMIDKNLDYFQSLIDDRVALDGLGNQLIHYASFFNFLELIEKLLDMGADINSRNTALGLTPLMIVAMNGYISSFKTILQFASGLKLEIPDNDGWTAVTYATAPPDESLRKFRDIAIGVGLMIVGGGFAYNSPYQYGRTIGTIMSIGGGTYLAFTLSDEDGSSTEVHLPYNRCKHVWHCDHSKIKNSLLKNGADKTKAYPSIIKIVNLFSS